LHRTAIYQLSSTNIEFTSGLRIFELSNHLGNVLTTLTDRKLHRDFNLNDTADFYCSDTTSFHDYYPYGMEKPGRGSNPTGYRFGFNGVEADNALMPGRTGYNFGSRMYDGRTGRWMKSDPKRHQYPSYSPYHSMYNNPIIVIDGDGEENVIIVGNANDPKDPATSPSQRNMLGTALTMAIQLKQRNDLAGEQTTMLIYNYAGIYSKSELENITKMATAKKIEVKIIANTQSLIEYVNSKGGTRENDPITDFAYVGHGRHDMMLHTLNNPEAMKAESEVDLRPSDFSGNAFDRLNGRAYLISCRSAANAVNLTTEFSKMVGDFALGASGDVIHGASAPGVNTGAGSFFFQNGLGGKTTPVTFEGRPKIDPMPMREVTSIGANNVETKLEE
jgi:RHS repeat-associated protein